MAVKHFYSTAFNGRQLDLGPALWALLLLVCLYTRVGHSSENLPFALGAPFLPQQPLALDESDRQWLNARKALRVGISVADHEPVDITTDRNRYQGISADYLSVASAGLAIPVHVRGFAKRAKAVEALLAGDIDVLTSANGFERSTAGLVFSREYVPDRAVVFGRANDTSLRPALEGKRVLLLDGYANAEVVQRIYPASTIVLAPTLYSAMEALAHGEADALIANELMVQSYTLMRPYLGLNTKFDSLLPPMGFSFALRENDARLRRLFDRVLAEVDESLHREILGRWTFGLGADPARRQVSLNPVEQLWIRKHPRVVVASTQHPPYIFKDARGQWVGLNVDVLSRVSRLTGLQFVYQETPSTYSLLETLADGGAHMNTTLAENPERKQLLDFTYSFGGNSWVFLERANSGVSLQLADMSGKALALPARHALVEFIQTRYPQIHLLLVPTYADARQMVEEGEAHATIQNEAGAWLSPPGGLKVGRSVEGLWSADRFSVVKAHPELLGILNKALEEFSVTEMRAIRLKWLGAATAPPSVWNRIPYWIYWVTSASLLLGLVSLLWSSRLRYQIHQRQRAEAQLGDQLAFKRTLLDAFPNPVYLRDLQGRLVACNRCYEESFGISYEQMQGRRLIDVDLVDRDMAEQMHADYMKLLETQEPVFTERTLTLGARQIHTWQWAVPYHRADGQMQGMIGGWMDISERKRLEGELHEARQAAEQAAGQLRALLDDLEQARASRA